MTLDKAVKYKKEKRKPHRKAKAVDGSCRNHGSCPWCESGRQHFDAKKRTACEDDMKEWKDEVDE